jgi:cell division initiation protein
MQLTPIDIQQQPFKQAWRGYDPTEVREFLGTVAQQLQLQAQRFAELKQELHAQAREVQGLRERENDVKEAMLTAQRAIEEVRGRTDQEAQLRLEQAELEGQRIVMNAQSRHTHLTTEVSELGRQQVRLIEELRHVLSTHGRLLEEHAREASRTREGASHARSVLDRLAAPRPPSAAQA